MNKINFTVASLFFAMMFAVFSENYALASDQSTLNSVNTISNDEQSGSVKTITPPASITYPDFSPDGIFDVTWTAVQEATSYNLQRTSEPDTPFRQWDDIYTGVKNSFSENITDGTYYYRVRALSATGASSWRDGENACVVGGLAAPSNLIYPTSSKNGIYRVDWSSVSGATFYQLERCTLYDTPFGTCIQIYEGGNAFFDENVNAGEYRYQVKALNDEYESIWRTGTYDCKVYPQYTVTISPDPIDEEGGTVSGGGTFYHGDTVTLNASENESWTFFYWLENSNVVSSVPQYQFVAKKNRTLIAKFEQVDPGKVLVTVSPNPSDGGRTEGGNAVFEQGDTVDLSAIANDDWRFLGWYEDGILIDSQQNFSFIVNDDKNRRITAMFEKVYPIPTLSALGMILLSVTMLIMGIYFYRKNEQM